MTGHRLKPLLLCFLVISAIGCGKQYNVIQPLEEPLPRPAMVQVGSLMDQLPADTPDDKKPNLEDIAKFRDILLKHAIKSNLFVESDSNSQSPTYEIRGDLLEYKRGNGFLRFMFGMGIGSAKIRTHLDLVRSTDHAVVFGGDFYGYVGDGLVSGSDMFEQVSRNFADELKKQSKDLTKSKR